MNQPVTLSCTGLPAGGACLFDTNPVTPTAQGQNVNLTVKTTLASPPGTYSVAVKGTGGGVPHTVTAVLNLLKVSGGEDHTSPEDYKADAGDEGVEELDLDEAVADTPIR